MAYTATTASAAVAVPFLVGDTSILGHPAPTSRLRQCQLHRQRYRQLRKFQHPYAGPFTLLKKADVNAFVLDIPAHWRLHSVFNVSRLKLWKADHTRKHPPPSPVRYTAAAKCEVETIIEHKGTTVRDPKYRVKRVGYPDRGGNHSTYGAAATSCSANTTLRMACGSTSGWKGSRECWLRLMDRSFFAVVVFTWGLVWYLLFVICYLLFEFGLLFCFVGFSFRERCLFSWEGSGCRRRIPGSVDATRSVPSRVCGLGTRMPLGLLLDSHTLALVRRPLPIRGRRSPL
jgi:hypothetical protein